MLRSWRSAGSGEPDLYVPPARVFGLSSHLGLVRFCCVGEGRVCFSLDTPLRKQEGLTSGCKGRTRVLSENVLFEVGRTYASTGSLLESVCGYLAMVS